MAMWSRVGMLLEGLITLLKNEPLGSGSMWDRKTTIRVAARLLGVLLRSALEQALRCTE
jgi:hypothetical protein